MRIAETVTFGGSGLERAAHLRGEDERMTLLRAEKSSTALVFWRGKPLLNMWKDRFQGVAQLPLNHPVILENLGARDTLIFLGIEDDGHAVFAADISTWEPDSYDAEALGLFLDPTEQRHPDLPDTQRFAELRRVMTFLNPRDAELAASAKAVIGWHASHGFCARCGQASDIVQSGWQRTCPSCKTHHFPRTDPVVIMLVTRGNSVLMGRSPGWPDGMYSLLAGFIEPGETLEAAVRREVEEETGVKVGDVSYLASQPWPFPASLMFGCHGDAISEEITIDPEEIEEAMWVTRSDMMLAFSGGHPKIKPARKGAIARFLLEHWLADRLE